MYPSEEYLNKLRDALEIFYPHLMPDHVKKKQRDFTEREYTKDIPRLGKSYFKLQYEVRAMINPILESHLLGGNEIVVPHLEQEYENLKKGIKELKNSLHKFKGHVPLKAVMTEYEELLNEDIHELMIADLKHLCEKTGIKLKRFARFRIGDTVEVKHDKALGHCKVVNNFDPTDIKRVGGEPVSFYVRIETKDGEVLGYHEENLELIEPSMIVDLVRNGKVVGQVDLSK